MKKPVTNNPIERRGRFVIQELQDNSEEEINEFSNRKKKKKKRK